MILSGKKRIGIALIVILVVMLVWPLPDPLFNVSYSTILTDKNDRFIAGQIASDGQWRFPSNQEDIPEKVKNCLLMFEDEYFYYHPGINPFSIGRAIKQNIEAGRTVSGGSTLTMQIARLLNSNNQRTYLNKLYEAFLTLKLEIFFSKDELLRLYLSHAPFGGNVVGLEAASWRYYRRTPDKISWAEAATLAVLPNSPSLIFPGKNQELLLKKRNRLLEKLYSRGLISDADLNLSIGEGLPGKPNAMPEEARHLLTRVLNEGAKGQKIKTTLDLSIQRKVLYKVDRHHGWLSANQVHNAAAIIIEAESGEVVAYVGNTNTNYLHSPEVDIITARRSTGSILKPLLYGLAVEEGIITPKQIMPDVPTFFKGFAPTNFDNSFQGAIPANEALRRSLNVPFVYLLKDYSHQKFHLQLKKLGMNTLEKNADHYGLSLVLGGAEASLWGLTSIYAGLVRTINNYYEVGAFNKYRAGVFFDNRYTDGNKIERNDNTSLSAGAVWWMFKAMQLLGRPEEISSWERFASSRRIAWKTGTSFGFRDAWAIGTDGKYVVGVWAGNADGEGRPGLTGIASAAPLLFDIFDILPVKDDFLKSPPAEMKSYNICERSGYLAGINCEVVSSISLPKDAKSSIICPYHMIIHTNEKGDRQVNADCYPAYKIKQKKWFVLPPGQAWYYKKYNSSYAEPPEFLSDCKSGDRGNEFMEMIYPKTASKIYIPIELDGKPGRCVFEATHAIPETPIYWHLDEEYLGVTYNNHQMSLHPTTGLHKLRLLDEKGRELNISFEVVNKQRS